MNDPKSCPRCDGTLKSRRPGEVWCCRELIILRDLMTREATPAMREVRAVLAGRSVKSIDAQCRRCGYKIPLRNRAARRRRCGACSDLFTPNDNARCCGKCRAEERMAA